MTDAFREAATKRIEQLDAEERAHRIRREERAAQARATQHADAERRAHARQADAERTAAHARERLADQFGPEAAARIDLASELYVFEIPHRGLAVAHTRAVERRRNPALVAAGPANPSWELQAQLQRVLNAGIDSPSIVQADRLADRVDGGLRLLVDPSVAERAAVEAS